MVRPDFRPGHNRRGKAQCTPFFLPTIRVNTKGITIAAAMARKKGTQYWGMMDKKPGRPPTPTEKAMTPLPTANAWLNG